MRGTTSRISGSALLGAALLVSALGCSASVAPSPGAPAPAARCTSGVAGDVNGDGYAEVAVGAPGSSGGRGAVHVFYGQRGGLVFTASGTARDDQLLTQDTPGVPGSAEPGDAFGTTTLLADLNGDGCADLVVGTPGENERSGLVQVFNGSKAGLSTTGVQTFSVTDLPGATGGLPNESLGESLAAGDLDGDGIDDLAVGAPGLGVGAGNHGGGVAVAYGGRTGLDLARSVMVTRDTAGVPGSSEDYGNFGTALATGDFDGNGTTELAVGSSDPRTNGAVQVLAWTTTGFTGGDVIRPDTAGLAGTASRFCRFGTALASGDVHGDGRDDLAVGDPQFGCHDEETEDGMGAVALLPGSTRGLTTTGSQLWTQASPGVEGAARLGHVFGSALALAPLDRNGTADLVIGAPYDGVAGSVTVLLGSKAGLTTQGLGGVRYTQSTTGIPGTDERGDWFGSSVTAAHVQSRTQATLVIGTPGEDVGKVVDAGSFTEIPIGTAGPDPRAARTVSADTAGVAGSATPRAFLGASGGVWGDV